MRASLATLLLSLLLCSCYRRYPLPNYVHWNEEPGVFDWGLGRITLPRDFHYSEGVGVDSFVGHFTSLRHGIVIDHDIGSYAGFFANPQDAFFFEESLVQGFRCRVAMRRQHYPNSPKYFFAATFPDSGCANFYFQSDNPQDSQLIQQIARSFRPHSKPRQSN